MKLNVAIYIGLLMAAFAVANKCFSVQQYVNLRDMPEYETAWMQQIVRDEIENVNEIVEAEEDKIIYGTSPVVISLGQSCYSTHKIRDFGLRRLAYPFDWNVICHDALVRLIQNDFARLLDEKLIHFERHARIWNMLYGGAEDLQHGFTFAHICSSDATKENFFKKYWPIVHDRMQRRIRRFYKSLNSGKYVYFIRAQVPLTREDVNRESIKQLVELIKNKFPRLKFTIIAANYTEDFKADWHMPNVVNFYHSGKDNEENNARWKEIFQSVGLLPKDGVKK